jgi:hypothetical protein
MHKLRMHIFPLETRVNKSDIRIFSIFAYACSLDCFFSVCMHAWTSILGVYRVKRSET